MIEISDSQQWLDLNARLQQKKNALRKLLKEKGVLKREAKNTFDKYSYFSEAQYIHSRHCDKMCQAELHPLKPCEGS